MKKKLNSKAFPTNSSQTNNQISTRNNLIIKLSFSKQTYKLVPKKNICKYLFPSKSTFKLVGAAMDMKIQCGEGIGFCSNK